MKNKILGILLIVCPITTMYFNNDAEHLKYAVWTLYLVNLIAGISLLRAK
jgi:hypothetical protein